MSSSNEAYFRTQILLLTILWFTLENHIHVRPCTTWHMLKRFENKSEQTKCGQYATRPSESAKGVVSWLFLKHLFFQLWLQVELSLFCLLMASNIFYYFNKFKTVDSNWQQSCSFDHLSRVTWSKMMMKFEIPYFRE